MFEVWMFLTVTYNISYMRHIFINTDILKFVLKIVLYTQLSELHNLYIQLFFYKWNAEKSSLANQMWNKLISGIFTVIKVWQLN